jgi:hypothetical protein
MCVCMRGYDSKHVLVHCMCTWRCIGYGGELLATQPRVHTAFCGLLRACVYVVRMCVFVLVYSQASVCMCICSVHVCMCVSSVHVCMCIHKYVTCKRTRARTSAVHAHTCIWIHARHIPSSSKASCPTASLSYIMSTCRIHTHTCIYVCIHAFARIDVIPRLLPGPLVPLLRCRISRATAGPAEQTHVHKNEDTSMLAGMNLHAVR